MWVIAVMSMGLRDTTWVLWWLLVILIGLAACDIAAEMEEAQTPFLKLIGFVLGIMAVAFIGMAVIKAIF
jgi:hypothetical protein